MTAAFDESRWKHHHVDVGGVRLHCVEAGEGPPVILLHGFPETWYAWRLQIGPLADAGYRVIAPDLRGYGDSDKPSRVDDYAREALVADIEGLVRVLGYERATLVGHDWGGGVAWLTAMTHPEAVERLAILNAPHPAVFVSGLRRLSQLRRSWYFFFFQLPWLPERAIAARDHAWLRWVLRAESRRPDAFTDEDIERYVAAARAPGALTGGINYYRAAVRGLWKRALGPPLRPGEEGWRRIDAPTLVVWGERDGALGPELADPGSRWVSDRRVERLPHAGHWVQVDEPDHVNELLLEFLEPLRRGRGA